MRLSERMGSAARKLVESNRGATARSLERIVAILEEHGSGRPAMNRARMLLWPASLLYGLGARVRVWCLSPRVVFAEAAAEAGDLRGELDHRAAPGKLRW